MSEKRVFISHSHKDSASASAIVTALEQRCVDCWIAPRNVPPGGSYAEAILTAIETASCFVLIYSEHSNVSSHVLREVERALKFGVNIVPVRFDDSTPSKSLDYLLATVHWLAIPAESRERSVSKAADQIAEWLKNFLTNPAAPLPQRIQRFQDALVTNLEPPRKRSGALLRPALLLAGLVVVAGYATGYLSFPNQPDAVPSTASTAAHPAPKLKGTPTTPPETRPIGYAGVTAPRPALTTHNNSGMPIPNQPPVGMPDGRQQNPNSAGMYGPQPPPPPQGPPMPQQYGNPSGPGFGPPPGGGYGPPPPPPRPGSGRSMFGVTNGGPGQPPPNPGEPRP